MNKYTVTEIIKKFEKDASNLGDDTISPSIYYYVKDALQALRKVVPEGKYRAFNIMTGSCSLVFGNIQQCKEFIENQKKPPCDLEVSDGFIIVDLNTKTIVKQD